MAYYARSNLFGSPTSIGFKETMYVRSFKKKAERDKWVTDNQDLNKAVCNLNSHQIKRRKTGAVLYRAKKEN